MSQPLHRAGQVGQFILGSIYPLVGVQGLGRQLRVVPEVLLHAGDLEVVEQRADEGVSALGIRAGQRSRALVELGSERKDLVVLDADLSADCGLRPFENAFPQRFLESGPREREGPWNGFENEFRFRS